MRSFSEVQVARNWQSIEREGEIERERERGLRKRQTKEDKGVLTHN